MTWYFSSIGKPAAVRGRASAHFNPENNHFDEPERSVVRFVHSLIEAAISELPDHLPVKIVASGSQSAEKANGVSLTIEPLLGFVE